MMLWSDFFKSLLLLIFAHSLLVCYSFNDDDDVDDDDKGEMNTIGFETTAGRLL